MSYKLFLDDIRNPVHCITYMKALDPVLGSLKNLYLSNDWVICRNYECFKNTLENMGLPTVVSFDHDLAEIHYKMSIQDFIDEQYKEDREFTGLDCAKYLVDYCLKNKLKLPPYVIHSMNIVGAQNILSYLKQAEKWL